MFVCSFVYLNAIVFNISPARSRSFNASSDFSALFTTLTNLAAYLNSALNPLLYAFLSRNFRMGMREVFSGMLQRVRSQQSASLQQRLNNQQLQPHHIQHHQHTDHQHVSTRSDF